MKQEGKESKGSKGKESQSGKATSPANSLVRTDLAMELTPEYRVSDFDEYIKVTEINVDAKVARRIGKAIGEYVTIESRIVAEGEREQYARLSNAIAKSLKRFTEGKKNILVVGLGNPNLTADALGSFVLKNLIVTRHLYDSWCDECIKLSAFSPSVMGVTGIESFDIISGIVEKVKPDLVIAVDSLASAAISRIASAFQVCSSGITPGSGVSNHKRRLDKSSLGINVISIGVPMVVYADIIVAEAIKDEMMRSETIASMDREIASLIVTPKEVDILVEECGKVIAAAINQALGIKEP